MLPSPSLFTEQIEHPPSRRDSRHFSPIVGQELQRRARRGPLRTRRKAHPGRLCFSPRDPCFSFAFLASGVWPHPASQQDRRGAVRATRALLPKWHIAHEHVVPTQAAEDDAPPDPWASRSDRPACPHSHPGRCASDRRGGADRRPGSACDSRDTAQRPWCP